LRCATDLQIKTQSAKDVVQWSSPVTNVVLWTVPRSEVAMVILSEQAMLDSACDKRVSVPYPDAGTFPSIELGSIACGDQPIYLSILCEMFVSMSTLEITYDLEHLTIPATRQLFRFLNQSGCWVLVNDASLQLTCRNEDTVGRITRPHC